jgi:hypothetical protein
MTVVKFSSRIISSGLFAEFASVQRITTLCPAHNNSDDK